MSNLLHDTDPGTLVNGQTWALGANEKTYEAINFQPESDDSKLSYTPARMHKPVFNDYAVNEFKIAAYCPDWSQYDDRYTNDDPYSENTGYEVGGRGFDYTRLNGAPVDTLIVSFLGIVGDNGEFGPRINSSAVDFGLMPSTSSSDIEANKGKATFTDGWGDVKTAVNCGFDAANTYNTPASEFFNQDDAKGLLGAVRNICNANPNLQVSLSVGGWTMSEAFHWIASDPIQRTRLADSIKDIFERFSMFTAIDIDWEYPGVAGNTGNTFDDTDGGNYALMIQEIKTKLDTLDREVKISVALNAKPESIDKANVPGLIEAGVTGLNVMTYDLFGTPWATQLNHHTNLYSAGDSKDSVDAAVTHLIETVGVAPSMISIGVACYTRNAKGATIESISPLQGTYNRDGSTVLGSFESGEIEYPDLMVNYVDYENQQCRNGYEMYYDESAQASFLYNPTSQVFISLDTPDSAHKKAEYVREKGLGGVIMWTIDGDGGLLVNALREGFGCQATNTVVDMTPFYFNSTATSLGATAEATTTASSNPLCALLRRIAAFLGLTI